MWKGNLAGALTQATERNQLNSFLVAMSPLGKVIPKPVNHEVLQNKLYFKALE